MIEEKIYEGWAFTEHESEKAKMNNKIYKELREKYRIEHNFKQEIDNIEDYDVVLSRKAGYNHSVYTILKNEPELSRLELALIADHGNLCFGFSNEPNGSLYVFED
ncbi:hypothetical protein [Enterococcus devriesei]|uniref:hypothetical protein n=1 Tax=Enterococcus devriesei TaxID=319970 RepID=UPI0028E92C51|nr:hypothetical protein [Enterococcus devriesei]